MYLDFSCPVELRGYEIICDDRRRARAYLKLYNLDSRKILCIEARVVWHGGGEETETSFTVQNLPAPGRGAFTVPVSADGRAAAEALDLVFQRVKLEGGREWSGDEKKLARVDAPAAIDGRAHNLLAACAGRDAANFPEDRGVYWLCVCGRANGAEEKACRRCWREKSKVLADYARERVLAGGCASAARRKRRADPDTSFLGGNAEPGEETAAEKEDVRATLQRACLRQRNLLIRRTVTMAVIALLLLLGVFLFRQLRYRARRAQEFRAPTRVEETQGAEEPNGR